MEQSPPASNARIPPKAAPMPSIKWPQVDSPQEQSTGCLSVTKSPVVVRTVLRTASNKPPGVTRTVSSTGSIKQHDNTQLQEDIDAILPVPAAELLSPADVNVLREVGKVPVENRVWGTDDKTSEKFAADILIKIPEYARFDQRTLRIMCHAAQWRQFKRGQAMTVAGEEQDEFFIVITGTVAGRITVKKPQMNPEKGGEARDTPRVRHVPSDETLGEEIERLNSGQSVGMGALLTGWNTWRVGYTAQTKVEVLVVPRTKLESIETILKWSFDSRTLMDVLRDYQKLHPPLHAAQANAHSNPHSSLTQEHNRSRSEEWVTKISTAMRQIPSFRQLPQEAV